MEKETVQKYQELDINLYYLWLNCIAIETFSFPDEVVEKIYEFKQYLEELLCFDSVPDDFNIINEKFYHLTTYQK